jgi:photosystem II stability/assembly factor-like uncharacterized protein
MRHFCCPHTVLLLGLAIAGSRASAQTSVNGARAPAAVDKTLQPAMRWRSIGPANTSGRIDDLAIGRAPGSPDAIYVASASGGVFKSTNAGTSWTPVFDNVDAMMSIGAIAVGKSNPNVVWVGTGEANNRQSSSWGDGVYKSIDAGRSWKRMGLEDTRHIGRIVVDPTNADIAYVAAVGHLWGPNAERGVYKTSDGGQTWSKVLFVDENTGANDIVIDPDNARTLFASTYQRQRKAWGFSGGGPGSAIYKSTDAGATWTKLTTGLPAGEKGRIGLDVFRGDGRVVYATVEAAADAGIYRTTNGGESWERLSSMNPRPSYYSQIRVDPKDKNRVYLLGSNRGFYISDDGGKTFRDVFSTIHSEDHALWIDPDDPNHLIVGGDGGVSVSWDRTQTWLFRDNMPLGQFYEIDVDNRVPYTICGGLQDNGVWCTPSATRDRNGLSNKDAFNIGGGDGFYAKFDPTDPGFVYEESQNGNVARVNLASLERQSVRPGSVNAAGGGRGRGGAGGAVGGGRGAGDGYRWNWDSPIAIGASDPKVLYMGANVLFRSNDRASSWSAISPDLTARIDRDTLLMMGRRVTAQTLSRHDGQSNYGSLTSIGESPLDARVIYTGSDDGQIQLTRDGGRTWTNITARVPGLPPYTYVSTVLASRYAAGRVYATFDAHYNDDYRPYVFVSDDYGTTWRTLSAGLPETSVNRIREHPRNPRVLVLAHERGVHLSNDGGTSWMSLATTMPAVPSDDAIIHPRDNALIVGTHGRGIWILDDVGPLEALTADATKTDATLIPPHPARLMSTYSPQSWFGLGEFFAPNPEWNAAVMFYLRDPVNGDARIDIKDANGALIRSLRSPAKQGLNRVVWDLRMERPTPETGDQQPAAPAAGAGGGGGRGGAAPVAPLVLPGRYAVTVSVPGISRELRGDVAVESDPLVSFADRDRRARQIALLTLYDLEKTLGAVRANLRTLATRRDSVARTDSAVAHLALLQSDADRDLAAAASLLRAIEGFSGLPTADQRAQLDLLFADVTRGVAELNATVEKLPPALRVPAVSRPARRRIAVEEKL